MSIPADSAGCYRSTLLGLLSDEDSRTSGSEEMCPSNASKILAEVDELAAVATLKLQEEANQQEHCLRRMVLTANLIDDLADEMHSLKLSISLASTVVGQQRVRWADQVVRDLEVLGEQSDDAGQDDSDSDSDASSESSNDSDGTITPPTPTNDEVPARADCEFSGELDSVEDDTCIFDLDDLTELTLERCTSRLLGQENNTGLQVHVAVVEIPPDADPLP